MKNQRRFFILNIGLLLVLASFIIYGILIARTIIPAGSTPQQIQEQTRKYGLDRPVIEQYSFFLFTFIPGLTLLGIYGTIGLQRKDFQHSILTRILIILLLFSNTVTMLNFLITAHASVQEALPAFWMSLIVAALGLANFIFLLVIWNAYKWGVWAFGIGTFVMDTLKFFGHLPIFPVLFEFSAVIVLIYLIRPFWAGME